MANGNWKIASNPSIWANAFLSLTMHPLIQSLIIALMLGVASADERQDRYSACLPPDIRLEEVVSAPTPQVDGKATKKITVRETLSRMKARCRKGKLVDSQGREIRFYRLIGCWGNPPEDYQEQLARQERELTQLRKKYVVIEISCYQSGDVKLIN
jgi:hypothetical protein